MLFPGPHHEEGFAHHQKIESVDNSQSEIEHRTMHTDFTGLFGGGRGDNELDISRANRVGIVEHPGRTGQGR